MFVTAVCFLFLLKLKWPENKNIYEIFPYFRRRKIRIKFQKGVRPMKKNCQVREEKLNYKSVAKEISKPPFFGS